jgi:hypothetical protein
MMQAMDTGASLLHAVPAPVAQYVGLRDWLAGHRETVTMAGLLAFAAPVTFFAGALSVMRAPTAADVGALALWWTLYGAQLWALLLVLGYAGRRVRPGAGWLVRAPVSLLGACAAAAWVTLSTAGRAAILIEQGVVQSAATMHLHAGVFSLTMALLFFAHLRRSRLHEAASARLVAAQAAQRDSRRRIVQARLAAVQARIDPQLLFGMLEAVRQSYATDPVRAELLLDELIAFLRAALPRLRSASSSVPREAQLAGAFARLHALASGADISLALAVAPDAVHARFPPGVLLPLLDDALRAAPGPCALAATRVEDGCSLRLELPARPSQDALARVNALLQDVYGAAATLDIDAAGAAAVVTVRVPYELA